MATPWFARSANMLDDPDISELVEKYGNWAPVILWEEILSRDALEKWKGVIPKAAARPKLLGKRMLELHKPEEVAAVLDDLIIRGRLVRTEDGGLRIVNWKKWRPQKSGAQRSEEWRERHPESDDDDRVTAASRDRCGSVADPLRGRCANVATSTTTTTYRTSSPTPPSSPPEDASEDVRLRAEEARGRDRPPDLDPIFELLTQIGHFQKSPNHRRATAKRLRVLGYDADDVARAYAACSPMREPKAAFAKAASEPGRFKALMARAAPPKPAPPDLAKALGRLGAAFAMRSAVKPQTLWEHAQR